MRETRSGLTTDFILDEQVALPRVLAAIRSDGQEDLYAYGPEGLHAQRTITGTLDTTGYALLDAQGSLKHLTDSSGALTLTRVYDAWGVVRFTSGSASSRLGYTSELQDGNLVYLRARWYHTGLGTFTSRDTYAGTPERPQSLHRYGYGENRPTMLSDPSGYSVDEYGHWTPCNMLPGREDSCSAQDYVDWWNSGQWDAFWDKLNAPYVICHEPIDPTTSLQPIDTGIIISYTASVGAIAISGSWGVDIIIDLYGFGYGRYTSPSRGINTLSAPSLSLKKSIGTITGWSNFEKITVNNYAGGSWTMGPSIPVPISGLPLSIGATYGTNATVQGDPAFQLQWVQASAGVEIGLEGISDLLDMIGGGAGLSYGTSDPSVYFDVRSAGSEPTATDGEHFKSLLLMVLPLEDPIWYASLPEIFRIIDHNSADWEEKHHQ